MDTHQFLILGKSARGRALCELINRATGCRRARARVRLIHVRGAIVPIKLESGALRGCRSHQQGLQTTACDCRSPCLVTPAVQMTGEFAAHKALLELLYYVTWSDYRGKASSSSMHAAAGTSKGGRLQ